MIRVSFFLSCVLFWIIPGRLSVYQGRVFFIGPLDLVFILMLVFIFFILPLKKEFSRHIKAIAFLMVCLSLMKFSLGMAWSPTGLMARYFSTPTWNGPHETSWCYQGLKGKATRIDRKINFKRYGFSPFHQTFPIHFANDAHRFNWYGSQEQREKRRYFQFSTIWNGEIRIHDDDPQTGVLIANDFADIEINGKEIGASTENKPLLFSLEPGVHSIVIRYKHSSKSPRKLLLGWDMEGKQIKAIPSSRLLPGLKSVKNNNLLVTLNYMLHLVWFTFLSIFTLKILDFPFKKSISKEKLLLFFVALIMILGFFADTTRKGMKPYAQIMSGGNDWLTYETFARNILAGDILDINDTGSQPFFMQSMYRYFLAGFHLVFGEETSMVIFGQGIIMVCIFLFLYHFGKKFYIQRVGMGAAFLAVVCGQMIKLPRRLLDTTVSTGLSLIALYFMIHYGRKNSIKFCILSGLFLGMVCVLRGNVIPFIPIALCWIIWKTPYPLTKKAARAFIFSTIVICPLLIVGIRNYHVSGLFKILPSSGSINIWIGNHPPEQKQPGPEGPIPTVIKYAGSDPAGFAKGLLKKTLYILGIDLIKQKFTPGIFIPAMLAFVGFIYFIRIRSSIKHDEILLLFLWISTISCVLIAIFPYTYRGRLLAPLYPANYLVAAIFLDQLFVRKRKISQDSNFKLI